MAVVTAVVVTAVVRAAVARAAAAKAAAARVAARVAATVAVVRAEGRSALHSRCNQCQTRTALACYARP